MLKEFVIPISISELGSKSPHAKLLLKLQEKSVFIRGFNYDGHNYIIKNINASQPLSYLNNSIPTQKTFALIDEELRLNNILVPVKIFGQRYIVENRDDLSITTISYVNSHENFVSPRIDRGFYQLTEAGISTKWESLSAMNELLFLMSSIDNQTYPSSFAKLMFKPRDPIVFSENQPISMKIMNYIMIFCTILLVGAGGLAFFLEFVVSGLMWIFLVKLYFSIILLFYKCRRNLSKLYLVLCKPSAYWKRRRAVGNRS
jgi:hypothetical protein